MSSEPCVLAQADRFGPVVSGSHRFLHVQYGPATLARTESQCHRFVALLADSAANSELRRHTATSRTDSVGRRLGAGKGVPGAPVRLPPRGRRPSVRMNAVTDSRRDR